MKITVLAAATALTALLLAGCGGDNSSVATATSSAAGTTATTQGKSSATTSGSGSNSGATTQPSSAPNADTTTPSFKGDSGNQFCQAARDLAASNLGAALGGQGNLKSDLDKVQAALDQLKAKAPAEIKDDLNTFAAGVQKIRDFYAKYDYDQTKVVAAAQKDPKVLEEAIAGFSNADFDAASTRITAYGEQVCGISTSTTA